MSSVLAMASRRRGSGKGLLSRQEWVDAIRVLTDAAAILGGFAIASPLHGLLLESGYLRSPPKSAGMLVLGNGTIAAIFTATAILMFWHRGLYRPKASILNLWEMEAVFSAVALSSAFFFAFLFLFKVGSYSRLNTLAAIASGGVFVLLKRRLVSSLLHASQLRRKSGRRVLIYGCNENGRILMKRILEAPHMGSTVIGFLDDSVVAGTTVSCRTEQIGASVFEAEVLGRWASFAAIAERHAVDELLVVLPELDSDRLQDVLHICRQRGIRLGVVPQVQELRAAQFEMDDLSTIPVLRPYKQSQRPIYHMAKRVMDITCSLAFIVAGMPLWLVIAAAIRLDSRGPILFAHERTGHRGRIFRMYKFRTMYTHTDPYATSPSGDVDARITRVGRLLRMCGLDEIPQLLNVLTGEMSLVGPRPEMPFIVNTYTELQRQRLLAKPGITGPWQISADRHVEIHHNIEYDLYYIARQSLMLDTVLLLETLFFTATLLPKLLRRRNAKELQPASELTAATASAEPYVLLALDQRASPAAAPAWAAFVPALYQLADRWPVQILVAPGNVEECDRLLIEPIERLGTRRYHPRFVFYRTRVELRALVRGARLVVTDLTHVMTWTRESGAALLSVRDGHAFWTVRTTDVADIAGELETVLRDQFALASEIPAALPPVSDETAGEERQNPPFREPVYTGPAHATGSAALEAEASS